MRYAILTLMLLLTSSLAACSQTAVAVSNGVGYKELTPRGATVRSTIDNDRQFWDDVAAHNRQCRGDTNCVKRKRTQSR